MADNPITTLLSKPTDYSSLAKLPSNVPNFEEEAWRKRHSGVQGVARDILGGLGDMILTRLRLKPMYAESKRQHEFKYASQGLDSSDPNEALAAIRRVQDIDFNTGVKLRDQFIDNQRQAAAQESTAEARAARLQLMQSARDDKTRDVALRMLNTTANWDDRKRNTDWAALRKHVLDYSKGNGLDLSSQIPETYDPEAVNALTNGAVPVATQRSQAQGQERIDNQEEQFGVNTELKKDAQAERKHHNRVIEGQGAARLAIAARREAAGPRPPRVTNVQTYDGQDGYRYTKRSDGTVVKSDQPIYHPAAVGSVQTLPDGRKVRIVK